MNLTGICSVQMASRFVNHFRNTFLVASTATLAQAAEPGISPRLRRFHSLGPQPPRCRCGSQVAVCEALRAPMWRNSAAPLGVASAAILAVGGSSSRNGAPKDKPPKQKEGRGEPQNLRNVMHYFEQTMPHIFDSGLFFLKYNPPQLYTPNVILENHLRDPMRTARGLPMLVLWQNLFRLSYTMRYISNRLVILNQSIDPDAGTVTINFRILCVRKVNVRGMKVDESEERLNQAFIENAEWHDYLLTLHVTSHDRVWKVVITQMNPDRSPPLKARIANPLLGLRRRVTREQELPLPV